jgi:DNA-nicking Smr family endonuclease
MGKITLDLHDIFRDGRAIDAELQSVIDTAVSKKIRLVEIIPGKGSGQLRRRVMRFLHQPRIKEMFHRLEIDELNHGKMYVHFRF